MNIPFVNDKIFWEVVPAVIILIIGWILIKLIIYVEKKVLKKSSLDGSIHKIILSTTRIVLWILLILTALSQFSQIHMAPFVAVLGTAGAAIAVALKDSLGNVAGGVILLFTKPFVQGDEIELNGTVGIVDHIDVLTTTMHTYDNKVIIVPNGTITTSMVINSTKKDIRRVDCKFNIGYDTDIEKVKSILMDIVKENPLLLSDPEPWVGVSEHGDNVVIVDAYVWCATENRFEVKVYLEENVKRKFEVEGIKIPYPKVDVHVVGPAQN